SAGRAAAERVELRRAFADARFAEWREGVWLRPDNLARLGDGSGPGQPAPLLAEAPVRWLTAQPEGDPLSLAGELWDLRGWVARGTALLAAAPEQPGDLVAAPPEWAASVFAAAAAAVSFLRTDPLLPESLVPPDWPAERLRARYAVYIDAIQALVRHLSGGARAERGIAPPD
ncbi:MAG: phenylacetic acid degradation operon negative regulatory protein, partial [Actinomycetota bacterium]|nr:phenylacetic acid degradation operon negative regulatory protein [Actinomycetota bacterium]